jgi:periplasmic divalent cation tolerance protein
VTDEPPLVHLLTSFSEKQAALALARAAVEARVAACGQVIGPITSVYRWEQSMNEEEEYLCVMKVPSEGLDALTTFVMDRHPYDTPELTALPSAYVEERYLAWARESVT